MTRNVVWTLIAVGAAGLTLTGCKKEDPAPTGSAAVQASMNETCPIEGGPVSAKARTVEYDGKTIGFCCSDCAATFDSKTDEEKKGMVDKLISDAKEAGEDLMDEAAEHLPDDGG